MERAPKDPAPEGNRDEAQRSRRLRRSSPGAEGSAFVGRDEIVAAVVRALADPETRGAVIHGQRRIGKTALLQHLAATLPERSGQLAVYFDLGERANRPLDEVLLDLARAVAQPLALPEPAPSGDVGAWLRRVWLPSVFESLPPALSLVLLVDELDPIAEPAEGSAAASFHSYLGKLVEAHAPRLAAVIALGRDVDDLERVARAHFGELPLCQLTLLPRDGGEELVRQSAERWSAEAIDAAWELTRGHPLLLKALCGQAKARGEAVSAADVREAVDLTVSRNRSAFEWIWTGLPPAARVVAAALAHAGAEPKSEEALHRILRSSGVNEIVRELREAPALLARWDLIEATAPTAWRFRIELFRRLVARYKPLSAVKQDLEQIEPAADRFFRAADASFRAGQVDKAIARLRSALELNPNHGRAAELLADILLSEREWAAAREVLERLHEHDPAAARARLAQALVALAEAAPDEEKGALLTRAREIDKRNEAAITGLDRLALARVAASKPEVKIPAPPAARDVDPPRPRMDPPRPKTEPPRPKTEPPRPAVSEAALRKELDAEKRARGAAESRVTVLEGERDRLAAEARAREADRARGASEMAALRKELEAARRAHAAAEVRAGTLAAEREQLVASSRRGAADAPSITVGADPAAAQRALDAEAKARAAAESRAAALAVELTAERDRSAHEIQALTLERDQLAADFEAMVAERDRLIAERSAAPIAPAPPPPTAPARPRPAAWRRHAGPAIFLAVGLVALAVLWAMQPAALELSARSLTLLDRAEAPRIAATRVLRAGLRRPAGEVAWSSADPQVAVVSADGTITAKRGGRARIEARDGRLHASVDVVVRLPARVVITPAVVSAAPGDPEITLEAAVLDDEGSPWKKAAALTWTSTAPAVAAVTGGKLRVVSAGNATIEARLGDLSGKVEVTAVGGRAALEKSCDAGQAGACAALAERVSKGEDGPADPARALSLLEKACTGGALRACVDLGARREESGRAPDYAKALALYREACDGKDQLGCARLARMYETGIGVVGDSAKARELYAAACEAGELTACFRHGAMLELGKGTARDAPAAAALYQKACDGGFADACASLGNIRWNGSGVVPKDIPAAIALYEKACDAKHEPACTVLALKHKSGDGVEASPDKALRYFAKACAAGSKSACLIAPRAAD